MGEACCACASGGWARHRVGGWQTAKQKAENQKDSKNHPSVYKGVTSELGPECNPSIRWTGICDISYLPNTFTHHVFEWCRDDLAWAQSCAGQCENRQRASAKEAVMGTFSLSMRQIFRWHQSWIPRDRTEYSKIGANYWTVLCLGEWFL